MLLGSAVALHDRILVLSRNPNVISAARDAAVRVRRVASIVATGREALALLAAPGRATPQLVCDPAAAGSSWEDLLATASEYRGRSALVVVSDGPIKLPRGVHAVPADPAQLAAALGAETGASAVHFPAAKAFRAALRRGEITVRYQPIVRVADRRPVMVEALARWEPSFPPIGPERFVPLAARAGLMRTLSITVASRAVAELARAAAAPPLGVTVNIPPDLLVERDLPHWLRLALGWTCLRPADLILELTEAGRIADVSALKLALGRLRAAGHGVLLDDVTLMDPRSGLFGLPFAGLKLDRSVVAALPASARARQHVRRLSRAAKGRGQLLVAEGVTEPRQLSLLGDLGVGFAQGFLVGRPLPAAALPTWSESWRARRPF